MREGRPVEVRGVIKLLHGDFMVVAFDMRDPPYVVLANDFLYLFYLSVDERLHELVFN